MTSDRDFAEADALWEFVTDPTQPAHTDLERTVRRVQGVTGMERSSPGMPRDRIWAEVTTSATTPRPTTPSRAATGVIATGGWARQQVSRWQSVVSFGLMVAFLFSLLGIAHDRVMSPALATPAPETITAGLVAPEGTPEATAQCVAREVGWQEPETPPVRTPAPQYEAKRPAPQEIGQLALETYIGYMRCLNDNSLDSSAAYRSANTYRSGNHLETGEMILGPNDIPSTDGAYANRDEEITQNAIIPVNRPVVTYTYPGETVWGNFFIEIFWPEDVYELIDGRYGVVIGSVSTDSFRNASTSEDPFSDGTLTWVAFVEQEGQLFIDEILWFCTGEWIHLDPDGNEVATPVVDTRIACR